MGLRVGSITFGGISSGLPTQDIIRQLLDLERRPINLLETQRETFNSRLEIFQDLATKTSALRDALRKLDNLTLLGTTQSAEEEFSRFTATSSDTDVLTASASGLANKTSFDVSVGSLAKAERRISQEFTSETDVVGTGTFSIQVGSDDPVAITLSGSNNTVSAFVQAINDAADANVSASVLNDGNGKVYIVVQGNDTGSENTLQLDTSGLSGGTAPTFTGVLQAAADASITIDPDSASAIQITSSTNTFTDVFTGVSLQVKNESALGTKQRIDIAPDADAVVSAIQSVVTAFNAVTSVIQEQFVVDPTTNRGGPLIGDSTLTSLKQRLSTALSSQYGSGSISTAGQIGLSISTQSVLSLDEDKLRTQLASSFSSVRSFFAGSGGLADTLRGVADSFVDTVNGSLVARISGTSRSIQDIGDQIQKATDRLGTVEENLVRQFSALERVVSEIQIQGNFLAQFVTQQRR